MAAVRGLGLRRGGRPSGSGTCAGALLVASLLACLGAGGDAAHEADSLPGWMGAVHHVQHATRAGAKVLLRGPDTVTIDPSKVVQLAWKPRAFLYKGFLSEEEADHLINLARPKVERSTVADTLSGKSVLSEIRTSAGMFLQKYQDDVVKRIEERIAAWTFIPKENGEAIQVLRYNYGQKYDAHFDYFHDKKNTQLGGHRMATVLMYLSDVESGGETVFPSSEVDKTPKDDTWSDCGKRGVAVKPHKGDALLFFSLNPDASPDEASLHSGCPVLAGEKWSATKWIHVAPFEQPVRDPTQCINDEPRCEEWAAAGECLKNKPYMIGEGDYIGSCRKACKVCNASKTA